MAVPPPHELVLVVGAISKGRYAFIVVNFANGDMVGHTAELDAVLEAVEILDREASRVLEAAVDPVACRQLATSVIFSICQGRWFVTYVDSANQLIGNGEIDPERSAVALGTTTFGSFLLTNALTKAGSRLRIVYSGCLSRPEPA